MLGLLRSRFSSHWSVYIGLVTVVDTVRFIVDILVNSVQNLWPLFRNSRRSPWVTTPDLHALVQRRLRSHIWAQGFWFLWLDSGRWQPAAVLDHGSQGKSCQYVLMWFTEMGVGVPKGKAFPSCPSSSLTQGLFFSGPFLFYCLNWIMIIISYIVYRNIHIKSHWMASLHKRLTIHVFTSHLTQKITVSDKMANFSKGFSFHPLLI